MRDRPKKTTFEKNLEGVLLSFTDSIEYHPCVRSRPRVEYPDHSWWRYKIPKTDKMTNTLYIACKDRTPKEIQENIFHAILEKDRPKISYFDINDTDRYKLHNDIYLPNKDLIKRLSVPYHR